ncbi:SDR family NAD(P)-dependent oxidoreductase [Vibrio sp. Isolate25]|uniref:SDR family NAD(P)-dependent oxidoreductase n=1 Tax=Vibrio sp. Isolate25 TaxID=2908535 RepID=UPI001EFC648F|nr:SDR family NAD(P)-dependent oxidoreductase [Vibrio sp. Isolate25]MCG9596822.1 SDR family NAD(P)-dependent oxidoreductase [Vibrio sp. Isolate25]
MTCVLITGATSGIGRQLAEDYAKAGYEVVACGRNQQALEELRSSSPFITTLEFDLTELSNTKRSLETLEVIPEVWIFNAGDCEYIDDGVIDAQLIKRVFEINVIGLANAIEASQHHFQPGHIVALVGSIASEVALPRAEAYGASKAAVSYLGRTLQLDLDKKNILVSLIYPGFVKTPLTDKNTFPMPMLVSVQQASEAIRKGLSARKPYIYFPRRFTTLLRLIGTMPYRWQKWLTAKLISE